MIIEGDLNVNSDVGIILSLFMIAALLAVILYRRKHV
jgi:hypothetical protein